MLTGDVAKGQPTPGMAPLMRAVVLGGPPLWWSDPSAEVGGWTSVGWLTLRFVSFCDDHTGSHLSSFNEVNGWE